MSFPITREHYPKHQGLRILISRSTALIALIVVVALSPFLKGLYAAREKYIVCAVLLGVSAIVIYLFGKDGLVPKTSAWGEGFVAILAIGLIKPASYSGAISGLVVFATALALYYAFIVLKPSREERRIVCHTLVASASGITLWGLLELVGVIGGKTSWRIDASFDYANATASWLMLGFVLALLLSFKPRLRYEGLLMGGAAVLLGMALLLTGSRGAWLVTGMVLLLSLAVWYKSVIGLLAHLVLIGSTALAMAGLILVWPNPTALVIAIVVSLTIGLVVQRLSPKHNVWLAIVGGLVACSLMGYLTFLIFTPNNYSLSNPTEKSRVRTMRFYLNGLENGSTYTFAATIDTVNAKDAAYAAQVMLYALDGSTTGERLLSKNIVSGSEELEFEFVVPEGADGVELRFSNRHPGTEAVLRDPRLLYETGSQPLGNILYRALHYQLADRATRVRIDVLIGDGRVLFMRDAFKAIKQAPLLGRGGGTWQAVYPSVQSYYYGAALSHSDLAEILLDTGIVGLLLYIGFVGYGIITVLLSKKRSHSAKVCAVAVLAVVLHSTGEALMGFPVFYITMFSLLGTLVNTKSGPLLVSTKWRICIIVVIAMLALTAGAFALGEFMAESSEAGLKAAVVLNPFNAKHKLALAQSMGHSDEAKGLYAQAQKLEPMNPVYASYLAQYYLNTGDLYLAAEMFIKVIELQPNNIANYENAAYALAQAANALYQTSPNEARVFAEQVLMVREKFDRAREAIPQQYLTRSKGFVITPRFSVDIGRSLAILGRGEEAWKYLVVAGEGSTGVIQSANPWLSQMYGYVYDSAQPSNLLAAGHSYVGSTSGFTRSRMSIELDSDTQVFGQSSLRGKATETGTQGLGTSVYIPANSGNAYTASVYVKRSEPKRVRLRIDWFTAEGRNGYSYSSYVVVGEDWERISVTGIAPAGTTRMRLYLLSDSSGTEGDTMWADGWMIEGSDSLGTWVPGQFRRTR